MAKEHHNPFEGVTDFFNELGRMRQIGAHGYDNRPEEQHRSHASAWVPSTDILALGGDLVIRVDLAGIEPEDVSITFSGGVLTLYGERDTTEDLEGEPRFYIRERFAGVFRRAITLPEDTTEDKISAEFENGLAEIVVVGAAKAAEPSRIALRRKGSLAG